MGWSPLSTEVHNTSQYSSRTRSAAGVVLHHGATPSAQQIIDMEVSGSRQVSSHQVVKDKRNAGIVQEQFRAWSLSDAYWDSWAFTVECANESTNGWTISDESHETLAQLVADWATRYGFWPHRDGAPETWTVIGHREVYSIHGGSYATACPGGMNLDYVTKRAQQIIQGAKPQTPTQQEEEEDNMRLIHQVFRDKSGNVTAQAYVASYPFADIIVNGDDWAALQKSTGITPREVNQYDWEAYSRNKSIAENAQLAAIKAASGK